MSSSSTAQEKTEENPNKPLWKYVTRKKSITGGGNIEFVCSICELSYTGSYTRVKTRLLKIKGKGIRMCPKIGRAKLEELRKIEDEAVLKNESSKAKSIPLPPLSSQYENHPSVESNGRDSHEWLSEDSTRVPPHQDVEITNERIKCLKRYFPNSEDRRKVNIEFARFSYGREGFDDCGSLNDRGVMEAKSWWLVHGVHAPIFQKIALKLLGKPCSSSCCERNWSAYSFIHSLRRNKMKPTRAENLVCVHTNLRLLSRKSPQYKKGESSMWDIAGDEFSPIDDENGILEVANLSLDEPVLERVYIDEGNDNGGDQIEIDY
ncbi:uncharacterized protein G2W53_039598 [Senna tora]|uniref:HAT C-terminal dimerisation domain-containing protein n=1 Tax=Senna tora TaxID=362788 RepID=A0A834STL4_9FABA|nr:uncharacterized protein G2W53_039598 [Senna tora]